MKLNWFAGFGVILHDQPRKVKNNTEKIINWMPDLGKNVSNDLFWVAKCELVVPGKIWREQY